ncbi:MAG: ExbD/TolR family protein [Alphaproteobacteria bacterium]
MKLQRFREEEDLVNMTPLIDVVFILLIFFMLAGAIKRPPVVPVEPPKSTAEEEGDEGSVVILVGSDGDLAFDGRSLASDADLLSAIGIYLTVRPDTEVQLKADAAVDAARVIAVMELLREAGARSLVLLTVGQE